MRVHISTKDVLLTPDVKTAIQNKLVRKINKFFARYDDDSVNLNLFLIKKERFGFNVKSRLDIPGRNIHAQKTHKELLYAITALASELTNRLRKKKEKTLN